MGLTAKARRCSWRALLVSTSLHNLLALLDIVHVAPGACALSLNRNTA